MAKEMSAQEIKDFLYQQRIGLLSLTDGQRSYAVPMGYSYDGTHIYIAMMFKGRKIEFLQKIREYLFCCLLDQRRIGIGDIHWKSVICDGTMMHLKNREDIEKAVRTAEKHLQLTEGHWEKLIHKAAEDPDNSMFWKINIDHICGHSMG